MMQNSPVTPHAHHPPSYGTLASATPYPECWKKRRKENQPLFDALPTLNSDEPKPKKRPY